MGVDVASDKHVVDIGAGSTGSITHKLCDMKPRSLTALELDGSAAIRLREVLSKSSSSKSSSFKSSPLFPPGMTVEYTDALTLDWEALAASVRDWYPRGSEDRCSGGVETSPLLLP